MAMNLAQMGTEARAGVEAGCGQGFKCRSIASDGRPAGALRWVVRTSHEAWTLRHVKYHCKRGQYR